MADHRQLAADFGAYVIEKQRRCRNAVPRARVTAEADLLFLRIEKPTSDTRWRLVQGLAPSFNATASLGEGSGDLVRDAMPSGFAYAVVIAIQPVPSTKATLARVVTIFYPGLRTLELLFFVYL